MPMTRESRMEKVQRLSTAHTKTKEMLEGEPLTRELHPGTDIARNWTVITAAYSGLEQTLKYLIAEERDLTIAELINYSAPKRTGNIECETGKYPYRTHCMSSKYVDRWQPEVKRHFSSSGWLNYFGYRKPFFASSTSYCV